MIAGQDRVGVTPHELGGAMVLGLSGELDFGNADWAGHVLRRSVAGPLPSLLVVLDLTEVGFLSAAGVHILYLFAAECAERGLRTRVVVEPDGIVERVARLAELDRRIPVFTQLSEALDIATPASR
jgi:anti-anti-sigma factor